MASGVSLHSSPPPRSRRGAITALVSILVVASVLAASILVLESDSVPPSHVECVGQVRLGNVSAWYPYAFFAAPFNGSESGMLRVWENYTVGGTYHNLTSDIPVAVADGDVKLGWAAGGNWTVYDATNISVSGVGRSYPCIASTVASLGQPNGPASENWGGDTVATGLRNDSGLPWSFNSSYRCGLINESPDCAVSAEFDLNFSHAEAMVDTCGVSVPTILKVTGGQFVAKIPFSSNGVSSQVPVGLSAEVGATAWFNYTFPANGGVWQYQSLPGIESSNSGLVFSYSSCR